MRLTKQQAQANQLAANHARVWLFGSRLDDEALGGDCDLTRMTEPVENPALLAATLSTKASRLIHDRKVDVLFSAPNLQHFPIHDIAFKEGKIALTSDKKFQSRLQLDNI